MVKIIGAGPGAKDLITVRGMRALQEADVIIYAGSLVNIVVEVTINVKFFIGICKKRM